MWGEVKGVAHFSLAFHYYWVFWKGSEAAGEGQPGSRLDYRAGGGIVPAMGSEADSCPEGRPGGERREVMLCPGCLTENEPLADFCVKCGRPLSSIATIDPYKRILATGHLYRQAVSLRPSLIVVVGVWVIFVPTALILLLIALGGLWQRIDVFVLAQVAAFGVMCVIPWRVTRNYLRNSGERLDGDDEEVPEWYDEAAEGDGTEPDGGEG